MAAPVPGAGSSLFFTGELSLIYAEGIEINPDIL